MERRGFLQRIAIGGLSALIARDPTRRVVFEGPGQRPYCIVVLGDSIAWGQGLRDEEKFPELVRLWLGSQLAGRTVEKWSFAHSGAVLGPDPGDGAAPLPGEVPARSPSVLAQLAAVPNELATVRPSDVDLVLLDGGINDVGVHDILTIDPTIRDPVDWIRGLARHRCVDRMTQDVLPRVLAVFPNARVVVTGYYSIVSEQTRLGDLELFLQDLGVLGRPAEFAITETVRRKLAYQCEAFYDESTSGLRAGVPRAEPLKVVASASSTAGGHEPGAPRGMPQGSANTAPHRAFFVDCGLTSSQAFGAPETVLWGVPAADPMASERALECAVLGTTPQYLTCREASAGHPNKAGAQLIAGRVIALLACLLGAEATVKTDRWCMGRSPA